MSKTIFRNLLPWTGKVVGKMPVGACRRRKGMIDHDVRCIKRRHPLLVCEQMQSSAQLSEGDITASRNVSQDVM